MGVLTQIKRTLGWLCLATLALSLLINYTLFRHTSELKATNQQLGETITRQETSNHILAQRITTLTRQRSEAQLAADKMSHRENEARSRLKHQIARLEKELENETCSTEPIRYPADWVSGY